MVRVLWDDLAAGKNVDEMRLRGGEDKHIGAQDRAAKKPITADVEQKATAASARIRAGKDWFWSGTIVSPEGVVATCAHALEFVMPGKKFTVCLADGRDASATLLGLNQVCDICLLKITDKGPWPHVELGTPHGCGPATRACSSATAP
jgi:S1-C subfamily serine protease